MLDDPLQREIQIFVQCGMSIWDALASATVEAGEFLGRPNDLSIRSEANLLVLTTDPTLNIKNLEKIESVSLRGKKQVF